MVVMILERAPPGLRGEMSRWMIEPKAGVFVGRVMPVLDGSSGFLAYIHWPKLQERHTQLASLPNA